VDIERPMPPHTYVPIRALQGSVSPIATGLAGAVIGALAGAGYIASKKLRAADDDDEKAASKTEVM